MQRAAGAVRRGACCMLLCRRRPAAGFWRVHHKCNGALVGGSSTSQRALGPRDEGCRFRSAAREPRPRRRLPQTVPVDY